MLLPDNTFIGRKQELSAVERVFETGRRLVTITGVGGAGKTRLALELARRVSWSVITIDLSAARQPQDLLIAMAGALRGRCPDETAEGITAGLANLEPSLFVMDAVEGALPVAAALIDQWHRGAPAVRFVLTSRIPLGLASEQVVQLGCLEPEESFALLIDRAQSLNFRFNPDEDRQTLFEVLERLEGIPLAIELAAARTQMLSPKQLYERLDEPLGLLRSHRHAASPRHAAMEATLEWSWELLRPPERAVLKRLWVFDKSFSVGAAEVVASAARTNPVLPVVEALVQHGLIRLLESSTGRRLRLLGVVREFVAGRLSDAEREEAEVLHTAYFMSLIEPFVDAEGFMKQLLDACDPSLPPEVDNLEAIVMRPSAIAANRIHATLALVAILCRQGPASRVQRILDHANPSPSTGPSLDDIRLDLAMVTAKRFLGTRGPSQARLGQAVRVADDNGRPRLAALICHYQGREARIQGDLETCARLYDEALERAERSGSDVVIAQCVQGPAIMHFRTGAIEQAVVAAHQVITFAETHGFRRLRCDWLVNLSVAFYDTGRVEQAIHTARQAAKLASETGSLNVVAMNSIHLAEYCLAADRIADAETWLEKAEQLWEEASVQPANPMAGLNRIRCWLALVKGELDDAEEATELDRWTRFTSHPGLVEAVANSCRGVLQLLRGEHTMALQHFDRSMAARERWSIQQADTQVDLGFRALARALEGDAPGANRDLVEASRPGDPGPRVDQVLTLLGQAVQVALGEPEARTASQAMVASFQPSTSEWIAYPEVVIAGRLLQQLLDANGLYGPLTLVAGPNVAWVQVGTAPIVDLSRRRVPQRLLQRLIEAHRHSPGQSVTTEQLLQAVWPQDKAKRSSLENRLWAAVSKLRKAGFDRVIERAEGGYRIPPDVIVLFKQGAG